jgi:hypothetical protein
LFEQGGDLGAEPAVVDSELFDAGLGRRVGHSAALAGCGLGGGSSPGAARVVAILEERGWMGWTRIERMPAHRLHT